MKTRMTALGALLALALPISATAESPHSIKFQLGDVAAELHDTPCTDSKITSLLPQQAPKFQAADVVWQGKALAACWAIVGANIVVVDETGDAGVLSPAGFHNGEKPV